MTKSRATDISKTFPNSAEVLQWKWNDESRDGKILFIVHKIVIEMVTKVFYLLFSYSYLKVSSSMI